MGERIHVGIGGWTFEPWRDNFYPAGLPQKQELAYASRHVSAIEINGTFYSTFKPAQFAKWRDETPEGFVFSLKANRFATQRKDLSAAAEPIARFVNSGIAELGDKLGPILWQLMPSAKFDAGNLDSFYRLLPREVGSRPLRHVIDARHESFASAESLELAQRYGVTIAHLDAEKHPPVAHAQSDLAYLRLMRSQSGADTGYARGDIAKWVDGARAWIAKGTQREVFMFFISGAKERNPAAAMEALRCLRQESGST
jgi:uncharacterized protein YecE (DUF72 family)